MLCAKKSGQILFQTLTKSYRGGVQFVHVSLQTIHEEKEDENDRKMGKEKSIEHVVGMCNALFECGADCIRN